ncbi:MAG TPA: hypothetical protein VJI13_02050 [Candidatus Norongarragalinales archaeon]|nr:hypothetical protein [Candidatus Norongarragalinales archaeon]
MALKNGLKIKGADANAKEAISGEFSFEECIIGPFKLVREEPKTMLPSVLEWIPMLIIAVVLGDFLTKYTYLAGKFASAVQSNDPTILFSVFNDLLGAFIKYLPDFVLIGLLYVLISNFLALAYSHMVMQKRSGKGILIAEAFGAAKGRLPGLLVANLLFTLTACLAGMAFLLLIMLSSLLGIFGILVAIMAFIMLIVAAFVLGIAGWVLSPMIMIGGKGGMEAFAESIPFAWKNIKRGIAVVLVAFVVSVILDQLVAAFTGIPYAGLAVASMIGLAVNSWKAMVPAEFYSESVE